MRLIQVNKLGQSYSFLLEEKPLMAWAISIQETQANNRMPVHGIPHHVLEIMAMESTAWTGWGFENNESLLLFADKEDAMFARIRFGEILNVQH